MVSPSSLWFFVLPTPPNTEDPLAPIRRAQLFGESLQALPRTDILEPSHRSSRVEEGRGSQRGPAARPPSPTGMLQNFYRVHWRPGFEAPDSSHGGSSDLAYPSVSTIHQECKQPGRAAITEESILIDVLTLGPPRSMQHVLMKFMGKRGKELGQAVFCIGELLTGSGGLSTSSRSSSLSGRWPPAPGAPSRGASSAGVAATKHTVDLTTGGRFKGTVSFELAVKTKRRAQGEGDALQRTMEEARSAGRGSGSG